MVGISIAIIDDGRIVKANGYGYTDRTRTTRVTPETLFQAGSISKSLAALGALRLVEDGLLQLDADVNTYLDFKVPPYKGKPVTMRNLMTHTGGFEETLMGLAELASLGARVEIRVVLHALSTPRLPQLAGFIYRRLPFVEHVAFMGLEPMGYAKRNRDRLWIDPMDYATGLSSAVAFLADRGIPTSIYNLPLCVLPPSMWPFARQSISDWKNSFAPECAGCAVRGRCAGFFASAGPAWRSRAISPLSDEVAA